MLDHYVAWRQTHDMPQHASGTDGPFSFCSYPFLLNPRAKSKLLHTEARIQMDQVLLALPPAMCQGCFEGNHWVPAIVGVAGLPATFVIARFRWEKQAAVLFRSAARGLTSATRQPKPAYLSGALPLPLPDRGPVEAGAGKRQQPGRQPLRRLRVAQ